MKNVRPVELDIPAITTMVAAIDAMADVSPRAFVDSATDARIWAIFDDLYNTQECRSFASCYRILIQVAGANALDVPTEHQLRYRWEKRVASGRVDLGKRYLTRRNRRRTYGTENTDSARIIEQLHGAIVETPGDLIATAKRLWPELWARIVERARAEGIAPGMALLQAIERGLDA